ncbi:egl [Cordylochernes scorpioides]|uniref:Egl n=1 Tax=Cordylochernes scorpioides TaxID=51811 RepID=A0ABY6LTE5_9ARAC|nr:egl [Cordylochernes scorpioides]
MDSSNYDNTKHMTIMFFLDKLMDKGQPRTLHDLSCQFGTKGFTKEMRQIAGGSQSGLKKFLLQYPSLFTIHDDQVSITTFSENRKDTIKRDYIKEAVEYFRKKLEQYGNAEVPIKSLLGHRSQASQEIRHISGQHVKDFKDFLLKHPDVFVVKDEYVVLKSVLENLDGSITTPITKVPEEEPLDPHLSSTLISFFENILKNSGPLPIGQIFVYLNETYPKDMWSKMVKNPHDLNTFLKMNSKIFLVQDNIVSLTTPKPHLLQSPNGNNTYSSINGSNILASACATPVSTSAPSSNLSSPSSGSCRYTRPSIQERLKSQIIKVVAENSSLDYKEKSAGEFQTMFKHVKVLTKVKESAAVVQNIMCSNPVVALDGEGINLGPSGPLTLIQLATLDGQIFIFDLLACPQLINEGGLSELLQSEAILKVSFKKLFSIFNCVQAAHAVLQQQDNGKPTHKVKNVSLATLCSLYGGPINPRRDQVKALYRRDPKFWNRRPLSDDMIFHAAFDVFCLVPTVYQTLDK